MKNNSYSEKEDVEPLAPMTLNDGKVLVVKGNLLTGNLDSKVVGNTGGSIIHIIWLEKGPAAAAAFLTNS